MKKFVQTIMECGSTGLNVAKPVVIHWWYCSIDCNHIAINCQWWITPLAISENRACSYFQAQKWFARFCIEREGCLSHQCILTMNEPWITASDTRTLRTAANDSESATVWSQTVRVCCDRHWLPRQCDENQNILSGVCVLPAADECQWILMPNAIHHYAS